MEITKTGCFYLFERDSFAYMTVTYSWPQVMAAPSVESGLTRYAISEFHPKGPLGRKKPELKS